MDRLRWLSDDMGQNYIFVNIADFSLEVMEDEKPVMAMRIIAGKDEQRSCVLSAKMTYLELEPVLESAGQHRSQRDIASNKERSWLPGAKNHKSIQGLERQCKGNKSDAGQLVPCQGE